MKVFVHHNLNPLGHKGERPTKVKDALVRPFSCGFITLTFNVSVEKLRSGVGGLY